MIFNTKRGVNSARAYRKNVCAEYEHKEIHYLSCSGAESINDSNRAEHTVTRNEVDAMCYEPCKRSNL